MGFPLHTHTWRLLVAVGFLSGLSMLCVLSSASRESSVLQSDDKSWEFEIENRTSFCRGKLAVVCGLEVDAMVRVGQRVQYPLPGSHW